MENQSAVARAPREKNRVPFGAGAYCDVFQTDQIKCGVLTVPAGRKAGYDAGHVDIDEVFYIAEGEATIEFPGLGKTAVAKAGEFVLIPRSQAHVVSNRKEQDLKLVYASCEKV